MNERLADAYQRLGLGPTTYNSTLTLRTKLQGHKEKLFGTSRSSGKGWKNLRCHDGSMGQVYLPTCLVDFLIANGGKYNGKYIPFPWIQSANLG